uniref:NADH-ubiquinone oxidoreductase chain 3 n=1 Tax=Nipponacmea fuscoviridis TaxID=225302 RepID=A0A6B9Q8R7_9GAST|nr:NADH dehydrogenase subunit 3 [Nipponacmea fuscoviridis]QHE50290.1 NADH dehydrogenase subunit 3 [Nipponacmea fuscoviridis]QVH34243.1 NADH dehydrogenase subunit 3 [Nipponacmea fuscoviridis]
MKSVGCASLVVVLLTLGLFGVALAGSARRAKDSQKSTPFECGFDPCGSGRFPFSLQFFLVGIIFLVFDMEIALMYPLASADMGDLSESSYLSGGVFLVVVLGGLLHEWKEGSLEWKR